MPRKSTTKRTRYIDYGHLPELLGYHLRLTQIAVFRDLAAHLKEFAITPTLYGALVIIDTNPGLKQSELAQAIQLDRSTVVTVVDKLQRRELVQRKRMDDDRRSNAVALTAKGKRLLRKMLPIVQQHEQRLAAHLSEDEKLTLLSLLAKIFPEN